jgi:hypothetical protein
MKKLLLIFVLLTSHLALAQHQKITKLLNKQLQREYTKFYDDYERATFTVTQPFHIDENNVLHFGFTMENTNGEKININRQVPLGKITAFDKDLNVYFQTLGNDITETRTDYDSKGNIIRTTTEQTHLFITEINKEHHPNKFMKQVVKAFKKSGYDIESQIH